MYFEIEFVCRQGNQGIPGLHGQKGQKGDPFVAGVKGKPCTQCFAFYAS